MTTQLKTRPFWKTFGRNDTRTGQDAATRLHLTALGAHKQR